MEKQSPLSRFKSKYLLLILAVLVPTLTFAAGASLPKQVEVKGSQTTVTITPTLSPTQMPMPALSPTPTETPVPTLTPTKTTFPTRVYLPPTKVYVPPTQAPAAVQSDSQLDNNNYYTNSAGDTIHSPANTVDGSVPAGASARCADGTYSFSASRRGTCSHHGGVEEWL